MGATLDKFMTIEEVPEEWRSLDVTVGGPVDASNFCDNGVRTYKYNLLNFFPKSMFEQMRRTANQYFLLICIMMFLGTYTTWFYSPLTPWSTFLPLMIILLVTMAKEGFEDVKRHQSDKRVNNTPATILSTDPGDAPGITQTLRRKDLRPGHVVVIGDREEIPADLILLWSSEGPQAYVETSNIDGETNLKIKKPALIDDEPIIQSPETAKNTQLSSTFEPPCGRVHTFEGTLRAKEQSIPLDATQFLLRGSTLRNTKTALGVVAYTGRDTRLVRNSRDVPSKLSELERVVNMMVYFILFAMIIITTISMIAYVVWFSGHKAHLWYMCYRYNNADVPALFRENCESSDNYAPGSTWPTFFILYNNFVPISLYVTIEMINYVQASYIDNDLEMYDDEDDVPALARTSNMNADLGMIAHIFSDKTGTLTRNIMEFKKCACAGQIYEKGATLRGKVASSSVERDLVEIMAVCHTVVPDEDGYQAESPDEEALVKGAAELGMKFTARSTEGVEVDGKRYLVLATIPFNSTRKRMSALVQGPDGKARILCKGADNIMFGLTGKDSFRRFAGGRPALDDCLQQFSRVGLRTLVLGRRDVSRSEKDKFLKAWRAAETATEDRKGKLAEAAALIERDFEIVGATAIEDRLQDGVPETIHELARAEIKLWVLTGDKVETAINIAKSAKLLTDDMFLVKLPAEGATKGPEGDWGLGAQLTALEAVVQRAATPDPAAVSARSSLQESTLREPLDDDPQRTPASLASDHLALVVEGATAMETILGNEELEQRFLKLANVCKAVVACRVSPAQKRLIVGLVRRKDTTRPVTLAIGDGANDVGMIQEAHIGVGISGKEGRQAVNNSDFAIGQFRFLKPLLLKHGRRNYRRMSKVIVYSFFKNIVLTFVLFYYQADCGWSGTSFYEAWVYSGFNFFLAFTPLAFGWFDVDTSAETVRKYPRLYAAGLHRMDLNVTNMAYATLEAVGASLLIYFITRQVYWRPQNVWTHRGKDGDLWVFGTAVFVGMVNAMLLRAALLVDSWNKYHVYFFFMQFLALYAFVIFMSEVWPTKSVDWFLDYDYYGVAFHSFELGVYWLLTFILVPVACAALQLLVVGVHLEFFPNVNDIGRELDHGHVDGESLEHSRKDNTFVPLRSRYSLHGLVDRCLGRAAPARPDLVTQDSIRSVSDSLGPGRAAQIGLEATPESGFDYSHAADQSFHAPSPKASSGDVTASEII